MSASECLRSCMVVITSTANLHCSITGCTSVIANPGKLQQTLQLKAPASSFAAHGTALTRMFLGEWQESSKGKGVMPAYFFPNRTSPSLSIPIKHSSPSQATAQPHDYTPFQGFAAHPSPHSTGTSETKDSSQHSREGSQHSREGSQHSTEGSDHSRTECSDSRGSSQSASSKNVSSSGRSVRFDLPSSPPSSPDESSHGLGYDLLPSEEHKKGQRAVADGRLKSQAHNSSPVPTAFRCCLLAP